MSLELFQMLNSQSLSDHQRQPLDMLRNTANALCALADKRKEVDP